MRNVVVVVHRRWTIKLTKDMRWTFWMLLFMTRRVHGPAAAAGCWWRNWFMKVATAKEVRCQMSGTTDDGCCVCKRWGEKKGRIKNDKTKVIALFNAHHSDAWMPVATFDWARCQVNKAGSKKQEKNDKLIFFFLLLRFCYKVISSGRLANLFHLLSPNSLVPPWPLGGLAMTKEREWTAHPS